MDGVDGEGGPIGATMTVIAVMEIEMPTMRMAILTMLASRMAKVAVLLPRW